MKNKNMITRTVLIASLILIVMPFSIKAQGQKDKIIHTEKRSVDRNGKDSIVTICKEDRENGVDIKRNIVIRDGDTITNIVTSDNSGTGPESGSSVIINGDSVVRIHGGVGGNKNINVEKKTIIIMNGDSVYTVKPGDGNVNIDVDTATIRRKFSLNKSLQDADKKGITISDKYVIINLNKLSHKDTAKEHIRNVEGRIGLEGFDLGFTQFIDGGNFGVSQPNRLLDLNVGKSVNVNFRVADLMVNLADHKLFLDAGLEFDLHDYRFTNNITIQPNAAKFNAYNDTTANFSKDKLSTQYLELPLMLCYNSNPKKQSHSFTIGAGGYGGILLGAYTKQISDAHGTQHYYGDFHCNGIDYGLMGIIGYGDVQLYGKFNTSPLFQGSYAAPNLQSFTFGIRLFHSFKWS